MRFAFIASLTRRQEMRVIAARLESMGHEVVSTWIDSNEEDGDMSGPQKLATAELNIDNLIQSDAVAIFTELAETAGVHKGTRHFETGAIWAITVLMGPCRKLCVVGPRETICHYLHGFTYAEDVAEFLAWAKQLRGCAERTGT